MYNIKHNAASSSASPSSTVPPWTVPEMLIQVLGAIRRQLGMELAFIAEFTGGRRVFRYVDSGTSELEILAGNSDPLDDSFCLRVADGRMPELMTDARQNEEALTLPATLAMPVGAHLSVPIRFTNGQVFGTICCFSRQADESLEEHDLATMRVMADVLGEYFELGFKIREGERR